ncbi:hypothetical protein COOONC_18047 [Cooperia oncophora]
MSKIIQFPPDASFRCILEVCIELYASAKAQFDFAILSGKTEAFLRALKDRLFAALAQTPLRSPRPWSEELSGANTAYEYARIPKRFLIMRESSSRMTEAVRLLLAHMSSAIPMYHIKIIVREDGHAEVNRLLATPLFSFPSANIEVISLSREHEEWGTADVLRHYATKITVSNVTIHLCKCLEMASAATLT